MGAGDLPLPVDADRSRLKREECKRTKHDDVFSGWKVLIGPSDWEDYLLGKEGAARYRVHNLPATACPGVYELGIVVSRSGLGREAGKLDPGNIVVVYLGQADNVRTRLQRYGRSGAHLGHGNPMAWPNDCKTASLQKGPGVFEGVFSRGHSIVFRWAPMKSKADALRTEDQLLDTFDYAWNKGCNGDRRPDDILGKLEKVRSRVAQFSTMVRKVLPFTQKQVGIKIEATKLLSSEKISNSDANDETYPFFSEVFKVSRSRPRLVFDRPAADDRNTKICGVAFGDGSVCTRPPVEGRKRCPEHKGKKISSSGMKLNTEMKSQAESEFESHGKQFLGFEPTKLPLVVDLPVSEVFAPTCGFSPEDGSPCRRPPVKGRKRCDEHKGKRVYESNNKKMPERTSHCSGLYSGTSSEMQTPVSSGKNAVLKGYDTSCGVALGDGSSCTRPPVQGRKRCEEHKGLRINGVISKLVSENKFI